MKITFQKIKINLHDLSAIFLLTSITCCIDTILIYKDMMVYNNKPDLNN
jgi:hypothetical protein